jgi:protein O-GlcNAc transferase
MTVDPLTLESGVRRAVLLEEKGSIPEAIAAYREVLRRHPDAALAWTNLGNAHAKAGEMAEAEAAYRRAIEIAPTEPDALNNLAWLLFTAGRLAEAEPLARAAVAGGGPDPHLALDTLGHILAASGRCDEANGAYRRALESDSIDEASAAPVRAAIDNLGAECAREAAVGSPPVAPAGSFE